MAEKGFITSLPPAQGICCSPPLCQVFRVLLLKKSSFPYEAQAVARTDMVSNTADTGKLSMTGACPGLAAAAPCEHQPQGALPPLTLSSTVLKLNF